MKKKKGTVRYSLKEIEAMIARGESRTDWAKIDAMTEEELEASIKEDPDDVQLDEFNKIDWTTAVIGIPPPKDHINLRVDHDIVEWFKATGKGYQTLMNNVLRAFVQSRQPSRFDSRSRK